MRSHPEWRSYRGSDVLKSEIHTGAPVSQKSQTQALKALRNTVQTGAIILFVTSLTFCTDEATSTDPSPDSDASATINELFCTPLAQSWCEAASLCGCEGGDDDGCELRLSDSCMSAETSTIVAIDKGELAIDVALLESCVASMSSALLECKKPTDSQLDALFGPAIFSTVAIGESCRAGDRYCASATGICSSGKCEKLAATGESCANGCIPSTLCIDGRCENPGENGSACTNDGECTAPLFCISGECAPLGENNSECEDTSECDIGLLCDDGLCVADEEVCLAANECGNYMGCYAPSERACVDALQPPAACQRDDECVDAAYCDDTTETCTPLPALGEGCGNGAQCAAGLACDMFGTELCVTAPTEGEMCAFDTLGPRVCGDDLGCVNGFCVQMPGLDEPCTVDNRCGGELGCDFATNGSFCRPKRDEGEHCDSDYICGDNLYCDFSNLLCTAYYATNALCSDGNECGPAGSCVPDADNTFRCVPTPTAGEACFFDCETGLYCGSVFSEGICLATICYDFAQM